MPTHLWNRSYVAMILISTLMAIGFMMVIPILPKFALELGASLTLAGIIAGLFSITALLIRPVAGLATDRLNMRTVALLATLGLAVATLGYGISNSVEVLFFFRVLHGIAFGFSGTATQALGAAFIPRDRLGEGIGYMGLGFILASAVGPNLGLELSDRAGYPVAFYVSFGLVLASAVMILFLRYTPPEREPAPARRLRLDDLIAVRLWPLTAIAAAFAFTNGIIAAFIALVGEERGMAVGIYFIANAVTLLVTRPLAGRLVDTKGLGVVLYPAFVLAAIATTLVGFAHSMWVLAVAGVLYAMGSGASQPAIQTTAIRQMGPARVGVAMSTYFIGADVGQGLGPIVGGAIASSFGYTTLYLVGTALLLLGLVGFILYQRSLPPAPVPDEASA
ncbi:MFS transporter [Aestuariimicrobium ganziense]|uniref:MFS transporter n=1 Tax=Aestuariimicrobium ganziense TaxID=2773677 RepID=UPI0019453634|nr:MFS transporter [Aestuariimicrobium ganziense]